MKRRWFLRLALCASVALWASACAAPRIVHEEVSPYGRIIVVDDDYGLRTLLFEIGGGRQSVARLGDPDHLELAYTRVALTGLALCEAPRRILVVGLGGGTVPTFLRKHFPDAAIDVAEIDPQILGVAKKFFAFREDERMRVNLVDGRKFIEQQSAQRYDLVFLDAFSAESVPAHLTTQEFLEAVRRVTVPSGVVVGNVWKRSSNPLYDAMARTYQEVFDELFILDVAGDVNAIFLALPRTHALSESELAQRARAISAAGRFRFDLGDLVVGRFSDARLKDEAGRVLRDPR